jgi:histidine ammonia-lyase
MIALGGGHLTASDIALLAAHGAAVEVTAQARLRVAESHDFAEQVSTQRAVYGRTTGVGANRSDAVADPATHALGLLRSHATSAGPLRSAERVRAMLVVRLNQLASGGSGASPALLDGLLAMLDADALPFVREFGSIGTGDLSALATTALALAGEGATSAPLPFFVALGAHDALPFMSSNAATIGDSALAVVALRAYADAAMVVAALTFAAVDGNDEAFSDAMERTTPFPGARAVARRMRRLVGDLGPAARIQDPFSLRTIPQVHGAFLDALDRLDQVVTAMANAPAENPVIVPGVGIAHHGGFHGAYLAQALDAVASALAQSAQLTFARCCLLNDPALTTLPAFLSDGTPGASGAMIVEYVAASVLGALRLLAAPAGLHSVTVSRGVEDDASFASIAAGKLLAAVADYRTLVACELVVGVRAVRMRGVVFAPDSPLRAAMATCADLDASVADRDLTADLAIAETLLDLLPRFDPSASAPKGENPLR